MISFKTISRHPCRHPTHYCGDPLITLQIWRGFPRAPAGTRPKSDTYCQAKRVPSRVPAHISNRNAEFWCACSRRCRGLPPEVDPQVSTIQSWDQKLSKVDLDMPNLIFLLEGTLCHQKRIHKWSHRPKVLPDLLNMDPLRAPFVTRSGSTHGHIGQRCSPTSSTWTP